ncbi:zinc ABC transporter substrate-binding protein [Coraliomargarita algicola]|uniref:Zinc ABC transporter substrate-binding protein n=1 Tax=Coraliomargarita algicola TaxID=3092156 RepID=A0ABZ0RKG1_9BACT|nr:zinc ABC transporter substrate-binding protein [Coraliomargarita sp. J2-16]WPJ95911.1 zinc ABC transporter substrate-binding protein [Coraliomargarita sp. J2-16]
MKGLLVYILFLTGCVPQSEQASTDLQIWVSLLPQQTIVKAIVGEHATVNVMVRPGQSPETYSPGVPQMAALAKADLYFGIGMPLERMIQAKMERSMPQLHFVQTADLVDAGHEHDAGHVHSEETDPHVWMDPQWMLGFVDYVRDALIAQEPMLADEIIANAAAVSAQLKALDTRLAAQLKPYEGRSFYINHPSLSHFAKRYGIVQRSIEHGGSAPSAKQVAELVQIAKSEQVGAIFTQPEFGRSSASVLARALDVELVEVDVLSADYFSNMLDIAQRLQDSFK